VTLIALAWAYFEMPSGLARGYYDILFGRRAAHVVSLPTRC